MCVWGKIYDNIIMMMLFGSSEVPIRKFDTCCREKLEGSETKVSVFGLKFQGIVGKKGLFPWWGSM